ncbi:hypothetical protein GWK47_047762 [Chionoecetes opilio]|uniref:Uncharacterized protein n=1 Tax=Chionoecetes opilio TaxID=41210 RepID=A0A8J4YAV2_CHIOP|nr:hypothetical protein GWK47_047762 [Chionoecetes opilio]
MTATAATTAVYTQVFKNGNECRNPSGREQGREREEEELGDNQEPQEEGMDARGWCRLLSSTHWGSAAGDLCSVIATLARKLAATNCRHVDALTACRLIPLDKKPGCRPIGIGEVLRRIIGKCIMAVVKEDVRRAAGNLQVCAGQQQAMKRPSTP